MASRYQAEIAYIASIYPGPVDPQRRSYGPTRESSGPSAVRSMLYELTPVERGDKPFVMELCDCFQDVIDVQQLSIENTKQRMPKPVDVNEIVNDLLKVWTGGLIGVPQGAKPGIIKIINSVPSQAELREMMSAQTIYFEYLFNEGERLHQEKKWDLITPTMRLAATWLDRKRTWAQQNMSASSGPCPLCYEMVPNEAVFCNACKQQIGFPDGKNGITRFTAGAILAQNQAQMAGKQVAK